MTGFEEFLIQNGFSLVYGSLKEFNTYNNCTCRWINKSKNL